MRKLNLLLSSIFAVSALAGCGSQNLTVLPEQNTLNNNQSQVEIESRKGLNSFYTVLVEKVFEMLDRNGDKLLSFDEFKPTHINFGNSATGSMSSGTVAASSTRKPSNTISDPLVMFYKIDKNHDGKVTLKEAKNSSYFLGLDTKQLRTAFAKPLFDNLNPNKDKSITKDEFFKGIANLPAASQKTLIGSFFTADKNVDNALSFSEFEDLLYASFKASWATPPAQPAPDPNQPDPNQPDPNQPDPNQPPAPAPTDSPAQPAPDLPAPAPAQPAPGNAT
jgi:Ca2+-binding EF-hand superfamily protein